MATHHNFRIKNGLEVGGVLIVNSSGQLQATTISGAISATSIGVTNIVTNKVVKFNGSILDDSNITDTGSLITLGSNTAVTGTLNINNSSSLSGTQVYIKRLDGSTNLQRWGEGTSGASTYRFRIDQDFKFIANSGSGDNFLLDSSTGNVSGVGTISSGAITSTGLTVNGGSTNVVANFISTDGTAAIKLQDNAGNVELSAAGSTFQVQPSGGSYKFKVDSSGNTTAIGYLEHYSYLYSRQSLRVLNAAGNGWHDWATRGGGKFDLNVNNITASGIVNITGGVTCSTVNTGQGATEVHLMNQNVRTSDSPTFQDLTVQGNLSITGDINSYNVTDLDVTDKTITVGAGQTEANSGGSGLIVDGSGAQMLWDEGDNRFEFNKNVYTTGQWQGNGSGLNTLNASNLSSGTVPEARLPTQTKYLRSDTADTGSGKITLTAAEGLGVGGIRGRAIGNQSGDFIQLYERVNIGYPAGWGASGANAPTYGLSTHGGAQFNVGNVSGAPLTFNGNTIWHAGNDGSGSTLDADMVDGKHKDYLMHYKGLVSGNWDTIFSQTDGHMGVYEVQNISNTDTNWPTGAYTYGGVMSWQLDNSTFKLYAPHTGQLHYQTGWNNDEYSGWRKIWDTGNDGSGSGLDADTVDGIQGASFLRSDAADTATGEILFDAGFKSDQVALSGSQNFDNLSRSGFYNLYNTSSGSTNSPGFPYGTLLVQGSNKGGATFVTQTAYERTGTQYKIRGMNDSGSTWYPWQTIWTSGTDGSGSGLDADLLDGQHGSYYYAASNPNGYTNDQTAAEILAALKTVDVNGTAGVNAGTFDGVVSTSFLRSDTSDTMNGELNVTRNGGMTGSTAPQYSNANIELQTSSNHAPAIGFHRGGYSATTLYEYDGELYTNAWVTRAQTGKLVSSGNIGTYAWTSSNDGSGSGLDADTVDGIHGASFLRSDADDTVTAGTTYTFPASDSPAIISTRGNGGASLYVGGWSGGTNSNNIHRISSSSNLHIDSAANGNLYLNYYRGGTTYIGGSNVAWHAGNDGSGSGLDADLLDGQHGSYYTNPTSLPANGGNSDTVDNMHFHNQLGVGEKIDFTVGGDAATYYPVVISGGGGEKVTDFQIFRGYGETAPSSWGSSTHMGGLTFNYKIMGSAGWGGYPTGIRVIEFGEIYRRILGGIAFTAHTMKHVVWLRGGTATYHIWSNADISIEVNDSTSASNYVSASPHKWYSYDHSNAAYDVTVSERTSAQADSGVANEVYLNMPVSYNSAGTPAVYGIATSAYNHKFWNSSNDGSGSGLDADLLDGQHGSYYLNYNNLSNTPSSLPANGGNADTVDSLHAASFLRSDAGDTATGSIVFSGASQYFRRNDTTNYTNAPLLVESYGGASTTTGIGFHISGQLGRYLRMNSSGVLAWEGSTLWHAGNDGSGSGLDADLLDGQHGSYYRPASQATTLTGAVTGSGTTSISTSNPYQTSVTFQGSNGNSPDSSMEYQQLSGISDTKISPSGDWHNSIRMGHGDPYNYYSNTLALQMTGTLTGTLRTQTISNNTAQGWRTIWDTANDGSGSGLDADLLDGQHASAFLTAETLSSTNAVTVTGTKYFQPAGSATSPLGGGGGASLQAYAPNNGTAAYMAFHRSSQYAINWGLDTSNTMVLGGWSSSTTTARMSIGTNGLMVTAGQGNLWGAGNDGSGSGLDADLLDGIHASGFLQAGGSWGASNMPGSRYTGLAVNGGEVAFLRDNPNNAQMSVLADGAFYAGENNGFYSLYSGNSYNSKSGFYADTSGRLQFSGQTYAQFTTQYGNIKLGPMNASYAHIYTDTVGGFYFNKTNLYADGNTMWHAGNDGSGSGLDADLLDGYNAEEGAVNNSIVKRDGTASIKAYGLSLLRASTARTGITWYNEAYYNWQDYMAAAGATGCGPNGNLTAPTGLAGVTSWALRSRMEGVASYGWNWETGGGGGGGATATSKMSLQAVSGNLATAGSMTASSFIDNANSAFYVDPVTSTNLQGTTATPALKVTQTSAGGNVIGSLFQNATGNFAWGCIAEYRINGTSGTDKPSIIFSHANNTETYTVGFGYTDSNFRIKKDHGHRNGGWGTSLMTMDRSGNVTFAGNVTAYSDERLKTEIKTIENPLDTISKLRGVTFKWKESGDDSMGVIAQEVEAIAETKCLVSETPEDGNGDINPKNVAYGNMVGLLIEGMKEQQGIINRLEQDIKNLKDKIK